MRAYITAIIILTFQIVTTAQIALAEAITVETTVVSTLRPEAVSFDITVSNHGDASANHLRFSFLNNWFEEISLGEELQPGQSKTTSVSHPRSTIQDKLQHHGRYPIPTRILYQDSLGKTFSGAQWVDIIVERDTDISSNAKLDVATSKVVLPATGIVKRALSITNTSNSPMTVLNLMAMGPASIDVRVDAPPTPLTLSPKEKISYSIAMKNLSAANANHSIYTGAQIMQNDAVDVVRAVYFAELEPVKPLHAMHRPLVIGLSISSLILFCVGMIVAGRRRGAQQS